MTRVQILRETLEVLVFPDFRCFLTMCGWGLFCRSIFFLGYMGCMGYKPTIFLIFLAFPDSRAVTQGRVVWVTWVTEWLVPSAWLVTHVTHRVYCWGYATVQ